MPEDVMAALLRSLEEREREPRFIVARSGRVHEFGCWSLTHDGPCDCPLVLARLGPRRRPAVI